MADLIRRRKCAVAPDVLRALFALRLTNAVPLQGKRAGTCPRHALRERLSRVNVPVSVLSDAPKALTLLQLHAASTCWARRCVREAWHYQAAP